MAFLTWATDWQEIALNHSEALSQGATPDGDTSGVISAMDDAMASFDISVQHEEFEAAIQEGERVASFYRADGDDIIAATNTHLAVGVFYEENGKVWVSLLSGRKVARDAFSTIEGASAAYGKKGNDIAN